MKKAKLRLQDLKLESFITSTDKITGGLSAITVTTTTANSMITTAMTTTKTRNEESKIQ